MKDAKTLANKKNSQALVNVSHLPKYHGSKWIRRGLPTAAECWSLSEQHSAGKDGTDTKHLKNSLHRAVSLHPWKWPKRQVFFIADAHADAEAFVASLVASGGVRKTGPNDCDFKLTKEGRKGLFVIGGDCLDKGPSNLKLLDAIRHLMVSEAEVKLLAGNHDMRLLMGLRALSLKRDPRTEHLFVRMGPKVLPLLREIKQRYLSDKHALKGMPGVNECREKIFPSENWFNEFPEAAAWLMPEKSIERELDRLRKKVDGFEQACSDAGLTLQEVYAAALKASELFLEKKGEYAWFFKKMQLTHQEGSFLFIHAGLDDRITSIIEEESIDYLNALFQQQVKHDLFEFYYGPLANTMRTKYRKVDMPLTCHGVDRAYRLGVHAIIHGHVNRTEGQRIMMREGMIHIEGDVTMDRNSRKKEGLKGYGMGVTIIHPKGQVIGISNDYPYAKIFEPGHYLN
ncbi:metallophosphoesterase [Oleiphilus messinensis]|uniref:Metallophosphoesterase n=1 Tax=Oleiphilus messinensis TaxID=141451 RepID=A0A1Y0IE44_9GAMM|nr:metallophosphoesterase [Oleiphilus messinensis]ARU58787.1 metallophosphoesterase [Oleiphilus messinensis]